MNFFSLHLTKARGMVLAFALLLALPFAFAQLPAPTYGWNLGNTLEPPSGEGTWGPAATQALINAVADSGFNTIRLRRDLQRGKPGRVVPSVGSVAASSHRQTVYPNPGAVKRNQPIYFR